MTFLELCQRVREESGISGAGPVSVTSQSGILQKVVSWVRQADLDIKSLHKDSWRFLWRMATVSLTEDVRLYSSQSLALSDLGYIRSMEIAGQPVQRMSWDMFKAHGCLKGSDRQQPTVFTTRPDNVIVVFPLPDADYGIDIEYQARPIALQNNLDVSSIPESYHNAIVQKALMYYANHEEDNDLFQKAQFWYEQALSDLAADQLPQMTFNRGLLY